MENVHVGNGVNIDRDSAGGRDVEMDWDMEDDEGGDVGWSCGLGTGQFWEVYDEHQERQNVVVMELICVLCGRALREVRRQ